MTRARRRKHPRGIRPWKGGWQAYVRVGGQLLQKSYPYTTPLEVMKAWRDDQRKARGRGPTAGTFEADVDAYLTRVTAMPTYHQRAAHLALWLEALGRDRSRYTIKAAEIDRVMQGWLVTPTRPAPGTRGRPSGATGLAPATVRKRRAALVAFFSIMNGPEGENPARASAVPREPKPEARAIDYGTIDRILAAMPESLSKRRVAVLASTGLPPSLLQHLTPFDLNLKARTVRVRPRRKGAGVEARTVPLTAAGVKAFTAFHRANGYGSFSVTALNRSFKRACAHAHVDGAHLYDLRHSHGTLLYRATRDLATVSRMMLHASLATTARYAQAAMHDVDRAAAARADALLAADRKLSRKVARADKRRKVS